MQSRLVAVFAIVLLLAGCGGSSQPTAGPEEPATVAELDAAVQAAAQALLGSESLPIAVVYFDFTDREKIVRYEWIDYRRGGAVLAIDNELDASGAAALSRSDGAWRTASATADLAEPWRASPDLGEPLNAIGSLALLDEMLDQTTPVATAHDADIDHEVVRQGASDNSELWTLTIPYSDGLVTTRQWIINPDGVLQFHRIFTDAAPFAGNVGTIIFEYGVDDSDAGPIIVPELGTPLQLDELGIPETLRDLEE